MEYFYKDVERITGVQRLRLHHWIKEGFLIPSGQAAQGHGTKNIYTLEDLYKIMLLKKLIESGIHGKTAARFVNILAKAPWSELRHIMKAKGFSGLVLCIGVRFNEGEEYPPILWLDAPWMPGKLFKDRDEYLLKDTGTEMHRIFLEYKYDQVIAINMENVIDEIDSKL